MIRSGFDARYTYLCNKSSQMDATPKTCDLSTGDAIEIPVNFRRVEFKLIHGKFKGGIDKLFW